MRSERMLGVKVGSICHDSVLIVGLDGVRK